MVDTPKPPPELPLVVLVGLTGVGKSTAVKSLLASVPGTVLLPNRRELADRIVIPEAQRLQGVKVEPVHDRLERFRLSGRYRLDHAGGLAHALARFLAQEPPTPGAPLLLFDSLRGADEVRFAATSFVAARFIVLEAPPEARALRLATRGDAFDRVAGPTGSGAATRAADATAGGAAPEASLARRLAEVPGLAGLFDVPALARAARDLDPAAVVTAARVVAEESGLYDEAGAWAFLKDLELARRLRLDTGRSPAARVAARIRAWL